MEITTNNICLETFPIRNGIYKMNFLLLHIYIYLPTKNVLAFISILLSPLDPAGKQRLCCALAERLNQMQIPFDTKYICWISDKAKNKLPRRNMIILLSVACKFTRSIWNHTETKILSCIMFYMKTCNLIQF